MYIAYVYDKQKNVIAQFFELADLSISLTLNQQGNAQFRFRNDEIDFNQVNLAPYNPIRIVRLFDWNIEYEVFTGVIVGIDWDLDFTKIACRTFSHLLDRRSLTADLNFNGQTVDQIVNGLIAHANWTFPVWVTVDCWVTTIVDVKSYRFWQTLLSCLRDLAGQEYEFDVISDQDLNLTLKFKTIIGSDRTVWPDYREFRYDIADLSDANITNIKVNLDYTKIANAILCKSWVVTNIAVDPASQALFGRLEQVLTNNWDVVAASNQELQKRKGIQRKYDITPRTSEGLFYDLQLWDRVLVYIFRDNPIVDFTGTMKIIGKTLQSWEQDNETVKIWVFEWDPDDDVLADFGAVKNRVKNLEVKTA